MGLRRRAFTCFFFRSAGNSPTRAVGDPLPPYCRLIKHSPHSRIYEPRWDRPNAAGICDHYLVFTESEADRRASTRS